MNRQTELFATADAVLSECRRYRYGLSRRWEKRLGDVNFIMLNPSTADETADDPTIRRCVRFAAAWGYGGIVVTNLFAWRATDPAELASCSHPVGPQNDTLLSHWATHAQLVVCAWGSAQGAGSEFQPVFRLRAAEVFDLLFWRAIPLHCLTINADGMPAHPLYQPGNATPRPYAPLVEDHHGR